MRVVFPTWVGERAERRKTADVIRMEEMQFRKEIAERELDLKREIAERDRIIDERNLKNMEAMEKHLARVTEVLGANTMQLNVVAATVAASSAKQDAYFSKGSKAIDKIMAQPRRKPRV